MKATREELCLFHYSDLTHKGYWKVFLHWRVFYKFAEKQVCPICGSKCWHMLLGSRVHSSFSPIIFSTSTSHHHSYVAKPHISFWPMLSLRTWPLRWSLTEMQLLHLFQSKIFMLPAPILLLFQCPMSQQVPHCERHVPLLFLYFLWCCRWNPRPWIC